jgi:hypothetical protein
MILHAFLTENRKVKKNNFKMLDYAIPRSLAIATRWTVLLALK